MAEAGKLEGNPEISLTSGGPLPGYVKHSGRKPVYLHQLIFADRHDLRAILEGSVEDVVQIHKDHVKRLRFGQEPVSVVELVFDSLMDYKSPMWISDYALVKFFETQVELPDLLYVPTWDLCIQPIYDVITIVRRLGLLIKNGDGLPNLAVYELIVKEFVQLRGGNYDMALKCMESRMGSLTEFASIVSAHNIQYFLGKLKISTTVDLLHQIMSNPLWMGKFSALVQLLEVHEILWEPTSPSMLYDLASSLMSVIDYVMSCGSSVMNKVKEGFGWVFGKKSTEEAVKQADGDEEPNLADTLKQTESGKGFLEWCKQSGISFYEFCRENAWIGAIMSMVYMVFTAAGSFISPFRDENSKLGFFEKCGKAAQNFVFLGRAKDVVSTTVHTCAEVAREMLEIPSSKEAAEFNSKMRETMEQCLLMSKTLQESPEKFCSLSEDYHKLASTIKSIEDRYLDLIQTDAKVNKSYLAPVWQKLKEVHSQLVEAYHVFSNTAAQRQEPACLWIWGSPGIGKSKVIAEIGRRFCKKAQMPHSQFVVPVMSEYFTGYKNQPISIQEDLGVANEAKATATGMDQYLLLMAMVSCHPLNVNMADIADKKTFYNSVVHIVASNFPTAPVQAVNDMYAFERRRHVLVRAVNERHEAHLDDLSQCDCWKNKQYDDFSHLKFYAQNPIVTNVQALNSSNPPKFGRKKTEPFAVYNFNERGERYSEHASEAAKECWMSPDKPWDIDDVVDVLYMRYVQNKNEYLSALKRMAQKQVISDEHKIVEGLITEAPKWGTLPQAMLCGPPGTGKTTIMNKAVSVLKKNHDNKVIEIVTAKEFKTFMQAETSRSTHVFFHDLTALIKEPEFPAFVSLWEQRYDKQSDSVQKWYASCNETILLEYFQSLEAFDKFSRRCRKIDFEFKPKRGKIPTFLDRVMWGTYTKEDVAALDEETKHLYSTMVQISEDIGSELKYYSDHELIEGLANMSPKIETTTDLYTLSRISHYVAPSSFFVDMPADEMLLNVQKGSIMKIHKIFKEKARYVRAEHAPSQDALLSSLVSIVTKAHCLQGMEFNGMEQMLAISYNNGLLQSFKGHDISLTFLDKTYALITDKGCVKPYIVDSTVSMQTLIENLNQVATDFKELDVSKIMSQVLPPWILLVMGCFDILMKTIVTTVATMNKVNQNSKVWRAVKAHDDAITAASEFVNYSAENAAVTIASHSMGGGDIEIVGDPENQTTPAKGPMKIKHARTGATFKKQVDVKIQDTVIKKEEEKSPVKEEATKQIEVIVSHDSSKEIYVVDMPDAVETNDSENIMNAIVGKIDKQAALDPSVGGIIDVVSRNVVKMLNGKKDVCNGLMVRARTGVTVNHYFTDVKSPFACRSIEGPSMPIRRVKYNEKEDWAIFQIEDEQCPFFRDISCHMATKRMTSIRRLPGVVVSVSTAINKKPTILLRPVRLHEQAEIVVEGEMRFLQHYTGLHLSENSIVPSTPVMTFSGDCGSPVLACDSSLSRKLVAIHAAATSVNGLGSRIFAEDFIEEAVKQSRRQDPYWALPGLDFKIGNQPVVAVATVRQYVPNETRYWKSPNPKGEVEYEPAVMCGNDTRLEKGREDILQREILRWCVPRPILSEALIKTLDRAANGLADYYAQVMRIHDKELSVLTKRESLNGVSCFQHSSCINMQSSPGYPWSHLSSRGGKRAFFEMDEDGHKFFAKRAEGVMTAEAQMLCNSVDEIIHDARFGQDYRLRAFKVFFKDELLKKEKIAQGKTRTIAGCPLDLVLATRMYTHSYYAAMADLWNLLPPKVGVNPTSMDWHIMYESLRQVSDKAVCLDVKGWDFNLHPEVQRRQMIFVNKGHQYCDPDWKEVDDTVRSNMQEDYFTYPYLMKKGAVIQATGGQPSGDPNTAPKNSTANDTIVCTAFLTCMDEHFPQYSTIEAYNSLVGRAFYGDDMLLTVHESIIHVFNGIYLAEFFKRFGMEATSADKTSEIMAWKPLDECDFMSRFFGELCGYKVGLLKKASIEKSTQYSLCNKSHRFWKSPDVVKYEMDTLQSTAESCMMEAFLWGPSYYEEMKRHWLNTYRMVGCTAMISTFEDQWQRYFAMPQLEHPEMKSFVAQTSLIQEKRLFVPKEAKNFAKRISWNVGESYNYSGGPSEVYQSPLIHSIMLAVNTKFMTNFNQATVNLYPKGGEIPWHRDDEDDVDFEHGVLGVTLYGDGVFEATGAQGKISQPCKPGTMIFMHNPQTTLHRRYKHNSPTCTVTFRKIKYVDTIPSANIKTNIPSFEIYSKTEVKL